MIHMLSLDFVSQEIGTLGELLLDDKDDIFGSADNDIDLAVVTTPDNFFSTATVFNMLSVFAAEGAGLADIEIKYAVKFVTKATFFELTAVTFDFDIFVDVFIAVDVTVKKVVAEIKLALGFSSYLDPWVSVGKDGKYNCDINLAIFND